METRLKKARVSAGFLQAHVSKEARLSDLGYRNYETGKRLPRVDTAIIIAKALGTTVEAIWGQGRG
jgi:DNA-binding XRE family transcriptional regulator